MSADADDRLDAIRARLEALDANDPGAYTYARRAMAHHAPADLAWLLAEVDRLRLELLDAQELAAVLTGAHEPLMERVGDLTAVLAASTAEVERLRAERCAPCPILRQSNAVAAYWRERWDRAMRVVRRRFWWLRLRLRAEQGALRQVAETLDAERHARLCAQVEVAFLTTCASRR